LERAEMGVMEPEPGVALVHHFPVVDLKASFYLLAGYFSCCEGHEWEALTDAQVVLFKRIRGGTIDQIIADVVLPDRPRTERRTDKQILVDLAARWWAVSITANGCCLQDDGGIVITEEEWSVLRQAVDRSLVGSADNAIVNNWVRCGELLKPAE
jgi:hypothetical protein